MRSSLFLLGFISLCLSCSVHAQSTSDFARTVISLPNDRAAAAIAYGPDGRLFVLTDSQDSILAIGPQGLDGTESLINLSGPAILNQASNLISRATFDPNSGRLLVAKAGLPGSAGSVFSIDIATGASELLFSSPVIDSVSEIAVRSTGEIFVSNLGFNGTGGVFLIDDAASAGVFSATPVVTGLDGAAGLLFDLDNNLIFQNGNDGRPVAFGGDGSGDFTAEISRLEITDTATGLAFNSPPTLLAGGSTGEVDLIIDSEGDFFAVGTLGLYQLETDADGNLTGGETRLLEDLDLDFSSGLAFLPGSAAFDLTETILPGENSPALSLISNSTNLEIISLTLNVAAVPEPTTLLPLGVLAMFPLIRRRRLE